MVRSTPIHSQKIAAAHVARGASPEKGGDDDGDHRLDHRADSHHPQGDEMTCGPAVPSGGGPPLNDEDPGALAPGSTPKVDGNHRLDHRQG